MDLTGATALVTGGADGIGAGITERLAAEGMRVIVADLDRAAGEAIAAGPAARSSAPMSAPKPVSAPPWTPPASRRDGCAWWSTTRAESRIRCYPAADPAKWEQTLDLNLRAVMLATQLALGPMRQHGGGAIINVASVAGLGTTSHGSPEYAVAKAGVIRLTACLAPLREEFGVRANCICPGLVDTPASRRSRARMTPAERVALPPVLTPADIAAAAMEFLADDTLAGRIMVCRGGEPHHLLPLIDWQTM